MKKDERLEITQKRNYKVVKANEIIQRARYDMNLQELKVMAYCFSLIKPNDNIQTEYTFSISDYCKVSGIDAKNGNNYIDMKATLKGLRDKSFWLTKEDGSEVTVGWLAKATINKGSGKIKIKFDEDLQDYIMGLLTNYTQYELLSTLPMKSQYSFRLYELLKSYAFQKRHKFEIDDIKQRLAAEHYVNFKDFRKKVLEYGIREINLYTDLEVSYDVETHGRKVVAVIFEMQQRDEWGCLLAAGRAEQEIDGQMSLSDFMNKD